MRSLLISSAVLALVIAITHSTPSRAEPAAEPAAASAADRLHVPAPKGGRARPLVVVVGENRGAETTDFIIPYGVLKASGVAEVRSLSTGAGPIHLARALTIQADQTLAEFDAAEPLGADIVIVPAQVAPKDPVLLAWIRAQADRGAVILSVCEGARVVARAGLLDGRRATTHWSALKDLGKAYPGTTWVRDRRYVQDGPIISTTGVAASLPASLALVEAIGGPDVARDTARRLGVTGWGTSHRTADFRLTGKDIFSALGSLAWVFGHETVEVPVEDGVDDVALALRADVWSRSYRSKVVATHPGLTPVTSNHGLIILPDAEPRRGRFVIPGGNGPATPQLEQALDAMQRRYGAEARRLAVIGLEYDAPVEAGR